MKTISMRAVASVLISSSLLLSGCFFSDTVEVTTTPGEGGLGVNISFSATWDSCFSTEAPGGAQNFACAYFNPGNISSIELSPLEALLLALLVDPLVIQVPSAVSGVGGTFTHSAGNGNLVVQGPLASVPIDLTRSLTAEPGTSLYILSVPEAFETANPTGDYGFSLHLNAPPGTTSIPVKAVLTARVRTQGGQDFYPPVFPCVTDMASAPGGTINTSVLSSTLTLPAAASIPVCQSTPYTFGLAAVSAIPTLQPWAFAALALLLAGVAVLRSRLTR
jgi:IPTL-CTERM motif